MDVSTSNYHPVTASNSRNSEEFGTSLLEQGKGNSSSASNFTLGDNNDNSYSNSPFPSSSSSGGRQGGPPFAVEQSLTNNSFTRSLPYAVQEQIAKPIFKFIFLGVFGILFLIIVISAATGGGGGGGDPGKHNGRASYYGIDCAGRPDMLFGSPIKEHNGHYYQLIGGGTFASLTWFDAMHDAASRCHNGVNGYLTSIQSREENDFLLGLVKADFAHFKPGGNDVWIGGTDMSMEGNFEWFTGNSKTDGKVFWEGGSPTNGGKPKSGVFNYFENSGNGNQAVAHEPNSNGEEDCVVMMGGHKKDIVNPTTDGMWNDEACYARKPYFIVEYDA